MNNCYCGLDSDQRTSSTAVRIRFKHTAVPRSSDCQRREYQAKSNMNSGLQEDTVQFIIKTQKGQKPRQPSEATPRVTVRGPDKRGKRGVLREATALHRKGLNKHKKIKQRSWERLKTGSHVRQWLLTEAQISENGGKVFWKMSETTKMSYPFI